MGDRLITKRRKVVLEMKEEVTHMNEIDDQHTDNQEITSFCSKMW